MRGHAIQQREKAQDLASKYDRRKACSQSERKELGPVRKEDKNKTQSVMRTGKKLRQQEDKKTPIASEEGRKARTSQ